ncbi:polysaccharide deacetylase family protein [Micromonospora sp. WMMD882]|uniref:polysaccharide deacetylase family protein n=1 Tax=Micromonospora sp. WMMD882 TaxID=3015151 RepID=UPI00248B9232|nr:polysaccharide deacetylase family protein [Micromonospora sp. WMMD882]WBB80982.1 polysaccharide deacetylase family protein [Micromonospora sp. WMMD882]
MPPNAVTRRLPYPPTAPGPTTAAAPGLTTAVTAGPAVAAARPAQARPGVSPDIVDPARGGGRVVSLTFDDGPNPVDTPRLLDVLRRHRITAVFCLVGDQVDAHPEVVGQIVAAGHPLGNHSMRHDDMSGWSVERIAADLRRTNEAIHRAVPGTRIRYFRAPYGAWGRTPAVAASLGMRPLGWRLAIGDWEPPGADELARRLLDGITPGAVVLLHDGGGDRSQTVDAVARAVPVLRARRWRFALPEHRA